MSFATQTSLLALSVVLAWSAPAGADYGYEDDGWNGISYLATTAEEASVQLEPTERVVLEDLRPRDVLWLLYPTKDLPVSDLALFVREGGRLIIADDFGTSGPLLEELGVRRTSGPSRRAESFVEGRPALPILTAEAPHFVFFNVEEIVANHPAALTEGGAPLLSFPGGEEHLVTEVEAGAGQVLVIADPSIFLNSMLRRFYGNKQFAANVLRVYCPRDGCGVLLALPGATYEGRYRQGLGLMGDTSGIFRDAGLMIDAGLRWFSEVLAGPVGSSVLMVLMLWAILVILWLQVRGRLHGAPSPPLGALSHQSSPMKVERDGLSGAREDADFRAQARTLIAEAQWIVARAGGRGLKDSPAWLRIQSALLSLEGSEPYLITAEHFLALSEDLEALRRQAPNQS